MQVLGGVVTLEAVDMCHRNRVWEDITLEAVDMCHRNRVWEGDSHWTLDV